MVKREGVFLRGLGGLYYELGNNFKCDSNLMMPISLLLISNKKSTILQLIGY